MNKTMKTMLKRALLLGIAAGIGVCASAQPKTVITTLKSAAWTDSVASTEKVSIGTGPLSYSFFFKIDPALSWNKDKQAFMAKIIGIGPDMVGYYATSTSTNLLFRYHSNQYNTYNVVLCEAPQDGKWHHGVMTVSSSKDKFCAFYLDGTAVYTGTQVVGYKDDNQQMTLFVNKGTYASQSGAFGGCLAEVSVWNRVLSQDDVLALKAGRPDSLALNNGCLAFWPLEEEADSPVATDLLGRFPLSISNSKVHNFTSVDDFPTYAAGDSTVYVPINRLYPTNLVNVVVGDGASVKDDMFEKDTEVTLAATAVNASVRFVRWLGDVPESQAHNPTITLLADREKTVYPVFATPWIYSAKTLSDGYWSFSANLADGEVTITSATGDHALLPGMPVVDFTKEMVDDEDNPCSLVSFTSDAFRNVATLRDVRLPDTLRHIGGWQNQYNTCGCFGDCDQVTNVAPLLPPSVTYLAPNAFAGCKSLGGELSLGGGSADFDCRPSPTWNRGSQFYNTAITSLKLLKGFRTISPGMFSTCDKLTTVELAKGSVTNILANGFASCKAVTAFTMPQRPEIIAPTAFDGWTSNQCRFVVSTGDARWAAYMAESTNFVAWTELDADTRAGYKAKFAAAKAPLGLSLTLPKNQWLCPAASPSMTLFVR